jgi:hypothetical protein
MQRAGAPLFARAEARLRQDARLRVRAALSAAAARLESMAAIVVEHPSAPVVAPAPPEEHRDHWQDRGARGSDVNARAGLDIRGAVAELADRHLPAREELTRSESMAADAMFVGEAGRGEVFGSATVFVHEAGADIFRAVLLVADPFAALVTARGPDAALDGALHWTLVPDGPSATARADALNLLRAMRAPGAFMLAAHERPVRIGPIGFGGHEWSDEQEWRLFEDLATLEEWTGVTVPVPRELDDDTATRVAQAALWVRTQTIPARVSGPVTFRARAAPDLADADELRVFDTETLSVAGVELDLGQTALRLPIRVQQVGQPDRAGFVDVIAETTPGPVDLLLSPPSTRRLPPRRTQAVELAPPRDEAPAAAPDLEDMTPVRVARVSLAARAAGVPPRPAQTAPSVDALLDDMRGE